MAWFFCRFFQIWSYSLGDMWLGWASSQCIYCVIGLSYLVHVPTRFMELVATYIWPVVPGDNTYHHDDGMVILHILPNLVPQLGCSVAWVGWHLSALIVSQDCQTLSMHPQDMWNGYQHIHSLWFHITTYTTMRMAWWFCRSYYQIWSPSLGTLLLGWMASQYIDCVPGFSDLVHAPTIHMGWVATHSWPLVPCITSNNSLWIALWVADNAKA